MATLYTIYRLEHYTQKVQRTMITRTELSLGSTMLHDTKRHKKVSHLGVGNKGRKQ